MGNTLSATVASVSPAPEVKDAGVLTDTEATTLPIVPHVLYALLSLHVYNEPDRKPIPPGWSVLMECSEVKLDREGFYATAYVNDKMRHCVIAERGTADALGIRAGVWMYFDEPTIQFALADQFTKLVKLRLQMTRGFQWDVDPYILSFTGHSLGGVLAACQACREHTFAVTFEAPGCRKFVDLVMHPFKADDVDIITYLRQPNPINTLRPHCGYLVQLPFRPVLATTAQKPLVKAPPATPTAQQQGSVAPPAKPPAAATTAVNAPNNKSTPAVAPVKATAPQPPSAAVTQVTGAINAAKRMFSLASPQEFLRSRLLENSMPELASYLTRVEPVIRELLDHTQQVHSIASIVESMENAVGHQGQDVILVWPSHIMQFLEYFNITREMADPNNQDANLYAAYTALLSRLYMTESRPKHKIPVKFLNKDSQRLLALWLYGVHKESTSSVFPTAFAALSDRNNGDAVNALAMHRFVASAHRHGLSLLDIRFLNSITVVGENLVSRVLTAFQAKQYLSIITMRPDIRAALDRVTFPESGSKL